MSSSLNGLLSSSFTNSIRGKKDDDSEYDTSTMMYSDDSASSDSGNDNGNTHGQKSTSTFSSSTETFEWQHRNFYDRLDDQYCRDVLSPSSVMGIATISLDEHGPGSPPLQPIRQSLPHIEDFYINGDDGDDEISHGISSLTKGNSESQSSIFPSKKSASRRLKVATPRLTATNKLKSE